MDPTLLELKIEVNEDLTFSGRRRATADYVGHVLREGFAVEKMAGHFRELEQNDITCKQSIDDRTNVTLDEIIPKFLQINKKQDLKEKQGQEKCR